MRIAVFGKTGQVARELQRRVPDHMDLRTIGRDEADFTRPEEVAGLVSELEVDCLINAVAYTSVDKAEDERNVAEVVNAEAVGSLARAAAGRGIPLVHISTDYVFDGSGSEPRQPEAAPNPLGIYGATKLAGEQAIRGSGARAVVLRTSWVFSAHGANFVKTMVRLGAERKRLEIVADQVGGPTSAAAIADACYQIAGHLLQGHKGGVYHFAGAPDVSWADFARAIFFIAGIECEVADIPTSDYPTPATRPLNSRLDCSSTKVEFGIERPDWRRGLAEVVKELRQ